MLTHLNSIKKKPKRLVVIGSNGFIGGAVLEKCFLHEINSVGISRNDVNLLAENASHKLASYLQEGDTIVAAAAIAPCKSASTLVHNIIICNTIIEAIQNVPCAHFINISSDAVFADSLALLDESSPKAVSNFHGLMHISREFIFSSMINAPIAHLRPTLVYGAKDPHNGYGPNKFRRCANAGEKIVLFGNGEELRDHIYIEDVSEIIMEVINLKSYGSLNIATGQLSSFFDIAQMVLSLCMSKSSIEKIKRVGPVPHNGYRAFDISACKNAFPDFRFTKLSKGLLLSQEMENHYGSN